MKTLSWKWASFLFVATTGCDLFKVNLEAKLNGNIQATPSPAVTPAVSPAVSPAPSPAPSPSAQSSCSEVEQWAPYPTNGIAQLRCPSGQRIHRIQFASFGTPTGSCGNFSIQSACHASSSLSVVQSACVGKSECSITASDDTFGDPCSGTSKRLAIQYTCESGSPTPTATPTATPSPAPSVAPSVAPTAAPTATPPSVTPGTGAMRNISLPSLPLDVDYIAPGRGAELWMFMDQSIPVPTDASGFRPVDNYYRFVWSQIEKGDGVYDWTIFDQRIQNAIDNGQKFGFGVMALFLGCDTCDGYSYPRYLHTLMMSEAVKPLHKGGNDYVPNWNSEYFLSRYERMLKAVADHIQNTSYKGIPYANAIHYVDDRSIGSWGEWHHAGIVNHVDEYPAGMKPTVASMIRLMNALNTTFPKFQIVGNVSMFDANRLPNTMNPPEVGYHALTLRNEVGPWGFRKDHWGITYDYTRDWTDQNNVTHRGMNFATEIMNRWKTAPIGGEPMNGPDPSITQFGGERHRWTSTPGCAYYAFEEDVRRMHAAFIGNGNYWGYANPGCQRDNIRRAFRAMGYRIVVNGGAHTESVATDRKLTVRLNWRNIGIAPTYEKWNTLFELRNSSGQVVWSGNSSHVMHLFLPETSDRVVTDTFVLPSTLARGTYSLHLVIRDPRNYRKPFILAVQGRADNGSYFLGSTTVP